MRLEHPLLVHGCQPHGWPEGFERPAPLEHYGDRTEDAEREIGLRDPGLRGALRMDAEDRVPNVAPPAECGASGGAL
jgi:hypothetical protein